MREISFAAALNLLRAITIPNCNVAISFLYSCA